MDWTYFSASDLFATAKDACERASQSSQANSLVKDALVSIAFSAMTLEAYLSQAVFVSEKWRDRDPKIEAFIQVIGEMDDRDIGASMKAKYFMAYTIVGDKPMDRGAEPFQGFDLLVDLRNHLIHLKPDTQSSSRSQKLLARFSDRKLIAEIDESNRGSWVMYVSNPKVAKWACNVASSMIQGLSNHASNATIKEFFWVDANAAHFGRVN